MRGCRWDAPLNGPLWGPTRWRGLATSPPRPDLLINLLILRGLVRDREGLYESINKSSGLVRGQPASGRLVYGSSASTNRDFINIWLDWFVAGWPDWFVSLSIFINNLSLPRPRGPRT